jgi:hypothetical protein
MYLFRFSTICVNENTGPEMLTFFKKHFDMYYISTRFVFDSF